MSQPSKAIAHGDKSAADFVIEMLNGDPTYAINFDRVQWDNKYQRYVIVEYLLCEAAQFDKGITPFTSHPNRYFHKNAQKFLSLWQIAQDLKAVVFLVNYAKKGTAFEDQILLMKVKGIDPANKLPVKTIDKKLTRAGFSDWLRQLNKRGRR